MSEQDQNNQVIQPTTFTRAEQTTSGRRLKINPLTTSIGLVFLILALAAAFMFNARAVKFITTPPEAIITISGGLPTYMLGDRYLMQPGEYQLRAIAEGYHELDVTVIVGPDAEQDFVYEMTKLPGILKITTLPETSNGAEVLIDQVSVGQTPITIDEVAAGPRDIEIKHPRFLAYQTEVVVDGMRKQQDVEFTLDPAWANVTVTSLPEGAAVIVDGEEVASTPADIELIMGSHEVRLRKPGYKIWQSDVVIEPQVDQVLPEIVLIKSDGKLQIKSDPEGANVTIAGRYYGQTPLSVIVPPGDDYELLVTRAGYNPLSRRISIAPEEDTSLSLRLNPIVGTIRVATSPAGATLIIDGEERGEANQSVELTARRHDIRIELPGYAPFTTEVVPQPGLAQQLNVVLQTHAEAKAASIPQQVVTATGDVLRFIIPDRLKMGAPRREPGRRSNEIEKDVVLTKPFYLAEKELSNFSFKQFDPGHDSGLLGRALLSEDDRPVVNVSWDQAVRFCNWLSEADGLPVAYEQKEGRWQLIQPATTGYRLPTEAEWAWASRYAGGPTPNRFPWGNNMPPPTGAGNFADDSAANMVPYHVKGYNDNFRGPAPSGTFPANELGIYDLAGNVSEWINDKYSVALVREELTDPIGPETGDYHVIRGSNYTHGRFSELRWTFRDYGLDPRPDVGFRVARYLE